jgi:predicted peptidase
MEFPILAASLLHLHESERATNPRPSGRGYTAGPSGIEFDCPHKIRSFDTFLAYKRVRYLPSAITLKHRQQQLKPPMRRRLKSLSLVLVSLSALSPAVTGYDVNKLFSLSVADTKEESPFGLMGWLPPDYNDDPSSLHPCVITIQGSGEVDDVNKLTAHGPLSYINKGHTEVFVNASAIAISPSLPRGFRIDDTVPINQFVDYITSAFRVDPDRLSLIGLSFGGGVVWSYGKAHANRLSVMAPSCPHTDPGLNSASDYAVFSRTTIWAFHAVDDGTSNGHDAPIHQTGYFGGFDRPGQEGWMGGIAAAIGDLDSSRMLDSYPDAIQISKKMTIVSKSSSKAGLPTRTSAYSAEGGWVWSDGMTFVAGKRHQMTLLKSGSNKTHEAAWREPWGINNIPNQQFWKWLFAQKRGLLPTSYSDPSTPVKVLTGKVHPAQKEVAISTTFAPLGEVTDNSTEMDVAVSMATDIFHITLTAISFLVFVLGVCVYSKVILIEKMRQLKLRGGGAPDHELVSLNEDEGASEKATDIEVARHEEATAAMGKRRHIKAFGVARFLASLHIVAGHLYRANPRAVPDFWVFDFGYTWVPYFMMMSGFILSYARLTSRDPNKVVPVLDFVQARIFGIYPLYLAGLLIALALRLHTHGGSSFKPVEFVLSIFLMQAWIPGYTEHVLQPHCWFLSCIVPYWFMHNMLYRRIRGMSLHNLLTLLAMCWLVPLVLLCIAAAALNNTDWYLDHHWQSTKSSLDIFVIVLKFHPVCYLHIYVFGIATACLQMKVRELGLTPAIFKYGVSVGYAGLLVIFFSSKLVALPSEGLTLRLGALAPLHALTMVGMVMNDDPLSRLFSWGILPGLENLSYPQYIMQFVCFAVWGHAFADFGYWVFLASSALVGYYVVQRPLKSMKLPPSTKAKGLLGIAALPFIFVGMAALQGEMSQDINVSSISSTPLRYSYSSDAFDVRLQITQFDGSLMKRDAEFNESYYINPSLLMDPVSKRLIAVVRKHRMHIKFITGLSLERQYLEHNGSVTNATATVSESVTWESEIGIGYLNPTTFELLGSMVKLDVFPTGSHFCQLRPWFSPHNQTVGRLIVDGPQDPRLFVTADNEMWLSFFSVPATPYPGQACPSQTGGNVYQAAVLFPTATNTKLTGIDRMYAPSGLHSSSFPIVSTSFPKDYVAFRSEKNWLSFFKGATQYFITGVHPYTIAKVLSDSSVKPHISHEYHRFTKTLQERDNIVFHGGANPVLMAETVDRPAYYLSVFHTIENSTHYLNYAFEFMDKSPFSILRISDPLPLILAEVQDHSISIPLGFVSGLTRLDHNGWVAFSYGSSNAESRVLTMSPTALEELFT